MRNLRSVLILAVVQLAAGFLPLAPSARGASALGAQLRRNDRGRTDRPKREKLPPMNEEILADPLRVVMVKGGEADEQLGVLSREEALDQADAAGMDLVLISDKAQPPVVKIVDYGKLKYAEDKKKKEQKKKSKATEMKELKMSYKIGEADMQVRLKAAQRFLDAGSRVRFVVQFRGRENMFHDLGRDLLKKTSEDLQEIGVADGGPKQEGNRITMIMSPKPKK